MGPKVPPKVGSPEPPPSERSIAERLEVSAEYDQIEVQRLRDLAFEEESEAHRHRAKADALELLLIESRTAANIIRQVGLTVTRNPDGVPVVNVERQLAEDRDDG